MKRRCSLKSFFFFIVLTSKRLTVTLIFEMDVRDLKGNSYSGQDLLGDAGVGPS